jgi:hypothetical protein
MTAQRRVAIIYGETAFIKNCLDVAIPRGTGSEMKLQAESTLFGG